MPMGEYTYKTYKDVYGALTRMRANPVEVTALLDHERQHFEKARRLGYQPIYGVRMVPDFPPIIDFGFIGFEGKKPVGQDMIDILLAPDTPGEDDLILAGRIQSELERI